MSDVYSAFVDGSKRARALDRLPVLADEPWLDAFAQSECPVKVAGYLKKYAKELLVVHVDAVVDAGAAGVAGSAGGGGCGGGCVGCGGGARSRGGGGVGAGAAGGRVTGGSTSSSSRPLSAVGGREATVTLIASSSGRMCACHI